MALVVNGGGVGVINCYCLSLALGNQWAPSDMKGQPLGSYCKALYN